MQGERHTPKKKCQSKNESENCASRTKEEENENRQKNVNILNGVYYMYSRLQSAPFNEAYMNKNVRREEEKNG